MTSPDHTEAEPKRRGALGPDAHGQAALLLTESLIHMLVEIRRLTNAQAVDVVHTATEVKIEIAEATGESKARMNESLALLRRIESSFKADEQHLPSLA